MPITKDELDALFTVVEAKIKQIVEQHETRLHGKGAGDNLDPADFGSALRRNLDTKGGGR